MDLQALITTFLLACQASGLAAKTIRWYSANLQCFAAFITGQWWTAPALRSFLAALATRPRYPDHPARSTGVLSTATLHGYHRTLRRFFSWLLSEGHLTDNPMLAIKPPRLPRRVPRGIAADDLRRLLAAADQPRDRALLLLLADTAARASEICNLRLADVDLTKGLSIVHGKGGQDRFVFLSPPTAQALGAWEAELPAQHGDWLFPGQRGPLTASGLAQVLKRLKKRSGVTGRCNAHSFRHGFARDYLLDGGDLASLCDLLGHSDVAVTKMYSAFTVTELQRCHQKHSPVARLVDQHEAVAQGSV